MLTFWSACRYRHDEGKEGYRTVRSDFKEVYRLKVWMQSDDWSKRFRHTVETEARLMITIQSQVHHASHALLHEYTLPQDEDDDEGVAKKNIFFKMSHLEGYTLQQVPLCCRFCCALCSTWLSRTSLAILLVAHVDSLTERMSACTF